MKKILFTILIAFSHLLFASAKYTSLGGDIRKDKEIKLGASIGLVRDGALYSSKRQSNDTYKEATLERYAMSGELQAKFLKSFLVKENVKIKVGAGTSIYIQYDKPLHTGFKNNNKYNNHKDIKEPELPNLGSGDSASLLYYIDLLKQLEDEKRTSNSMYFTNLDGMVNLAKAHIDANFTIFGTLEIEKMVSQDFSVYAGADLGVDIALHKCIAISSNTSSVGYEGTYRIERRKYVLPHARGYFGVDYKNFEFEIGAGYPKFITFGFGYRFKF